MKYERHVANDYKITEEGLVANTDLGDGRLIPAFVLKSINGTGLKELLEIHQSIKSGDIEFKWGQVTSKLLKKEQVILFITCLKPQKFTFQIKFNLKTEYSIIDSIFQSKGIYITVGNKGDKISQTFFEDNNNFILFEIISTQSEDWWEKLLVKTLYKKAQKEKIPKAERKVKVQDHINHMRSFFRQRMKRE